MASAISRHDVFQAIADPTRRELLKQLTGKEQSISTICKGFSMSRTGVNKHLAVLLDAGLVASSHVGRETRYRAQLEPLITVREWLSYYEKFWDTKLTALKSYVENEGPEDMT